MKALVSLLLCLFSQTLFAAPVLYFFGQLNYESSTGVLTVASTVNQVENNSYGLDDNDIGSSLTFSNQFLSSSVNGNVHSAAFESTSTTDPFRVESSGDLLLSGLFESLNVTGQEGADLGVLGGQVVLDHPSSQAANQVDIFSLQLNMTQPFSNNLWLSDFSAQVDGVLTSVVSEPAPYILLLLGFICLSFRRGLFS